MIMVCFSVQIYVYLAKNIYFIELGNGNSKRFWVQKNNFYPETKKRWPHGPSKY
jgi:hypothetical protein